MVSCTRREWPCLSTNPSPPHDFFLCALCKFDDNADFWVLILNSRFYLFGLRETTTASKIELQLVLLFHIAVIAAVALLAVGASGLSSTKDQADPTKLNNDWHLAAGGAVILLLMIVVLFGAAVFTYLSEKKPQQPQQHLAQRLVVAVVVACPLLLIRVAGSTAYFLGKNANMNPISGTWGVRIGLYLVPEVLAALALLVGGLVARNVRRKEKRKYPHKA